MGRTLTRFECAWEALELELEAKSTFLLNPFLLYDVRDELRVFLLLELSPQTQASSQLEFNFE